MELDWHGVTLVLSMYVLSLARSAKPAPPSTEAGMTNTQIEIEKTIKRKYLRKEAGRQGSRKKVYSIASAIMIKLSRWRLIEGITGQPFITQIVTCGGSDRRKQMDPSG